MFIEKCRYLCLFGYFYILNTQQFFCTITGIMSRDAVYCALCLYRITLSFWCWWHLRPLCESTRHSTTTTGTTHVRLLELYSLVLAELMPTVTWPIVQNSSSTMLSTSLVERSENTAFSVWIIRIFCCTSIRNVNNFLKQHTLVILWTVDRCEVDKCAKLHAVTIAHWIVFCFCGACKQFVPIPIFNLQPLHSMSHCVTCICAY